MMIMKVYAVLDTKLGAFGRPWFSMQDGTAIREFTDAVNDDNPQNGWKKHPEDYALYSIGSYNDSTAELVADSPRCLLTASAAVDWVPKEPVRNMSELKSLPA